MIWFTWSHHFFKVTLGFFIRWLDVSDPNHRVKKGLGESVFQTTKIQIKKPSVSWKATASRAPDERQVAFGGATGKSKGGGCLVWQNGTGAVIWKTICAGDGKLESYIFQARLQIAFVRPGGFLKK